MKILVPIKENAMGEKNSFGEHKGKPMDQHVLLFAIENDSFWPMFLSLNVKNPIIRIINLNRGRSLARSQNSGAVNAALK